MFGELSLIAMKGCESFIEKVDSYLKEWSGVDHSFVVNAACPRFGSGEGKGIIYESLRGHDVFILCDVFNYGVTYKMYGQTVPMSPDEHFADLKRKGKTNHRCDAHAVRRQTAQTERQRILGLRHDAAGTGQHRCFQSDYL